MGKLARRNPILVDIDSPIGPVRMAERCHICHYEFDGKNGRDFRQQVNLPFKHVPLGQRADYSQGYVVWCDVCHTDSNRRKGLHP